MAAANQQEMVILHHLQELILSGTRCFESDDVDCHGILIDLRQGLRSLSVLNLQPNNFNSIQDTLKALIDQLEMRIQIRREQATTDCFKAPRSNPLGRRGRPVVDISEEQLRMVYKLNFSAPQMAEHFHCSTYTIRKKLNKLGLKQRERYTEISDNELDAKVQALQAKYPNAGSVMMNGFLQTESVLVTRKRLRESISRVSPIPVAQRLAKTIKRRKYSVPMGNSLWHMDGHMKLIRWGISTHGCIDGHSRLITYLQADCNNRATTVLKLLIEACQKYGTPSRIRSDKGGENVMVALFINLINGENRHSHITGRSVHNQRIERLWKDVFNQVIEKYYNLFYNLEDRGVLAVESNIHVAVLQMLSLPTINEELKQFQQAWNQHKISTANNLSPNQLWFGSVLSNLNTASAPIRNLYGESLSDIFHQRLHEYGINVGEPEPEQQEIEILSQEVKADLLSGLDVNMSLEDKFNTCLQHLTQLNML